MWNWKSSFLQPLGPCFCDRLSRVRPGGHEQGGAEDGDGVGVDQMDVSALSCTESGAKTRSDKEQRGVVAVPGWLASSVCAHRVGTALVPCPWPGCLQHSYMGSMPPDVPQCFSLHFPVSAVLPSVSSLFQQGLCLKEAPALHLRAGAQPAHRHKAQTNPSSNQEPDQAEEAKAVLPPADPL